MTGGRILVFTAGLLTSVGAVPAAEEAAPVVLPIPGGGFEERGAGWSIPPEEGISSVTAERAATGRHSLRIKDIYTDRATHHQLRRALGFADSPSIQTVRQHGHEATGLRRLRAREVAGVEGGRARATRGCADG